MEAELLPLAVEARRVRDDLLGLVQAATRAQERAVRDFTTAPPLGAPAMLRRVNVLSQMIALGRTGVEAANLLAGWLSVIEEGSSDGGDAVAKGHQRGS